LAITQVVNRLAILLDSSLAKSSIISYKRAWNLFHQCAAQLRLPSVQVSQLPIATGYMATFVAYLSQLGYAPSSIITYASAIGYVHKLAGVHNPVSTFIIQKMLAGVSRLHPQVDARLPITTIILNIIVNCLPVIMSNSYHCHLIRSMLVVAFFGLLRVGEITSSSADQAAIMLDQVQLTSNQLIITITKFKHNASRQPMDIVMPAQHNSICPVYAIFTYLQLRGNHPGPLFLLPGWLCCF